MSSKSFTATIVERSARRALGRTICLDANITGGYLLLRSIRAGLALLRGIVLTRRKILLGSGTRIYHQRGLLLSRDGITRLEECCVLDCLSSGGIRLGRNFKLGAYSRMIASGSLQAIGRGITIGDDVGIGEYSYIGGAGGVSIGDKTIVGQYFSAHPENHVFEHSTMAIKDQGVTRKGIRVGVGCWIGAKVTLCDGISIGDHCVIAAGSVVTRSFPNNSVIGGVPARLIKTTTNRGMTGPAA